VGYTEPRSRTADPGIPDFHPAGVPADGGYDLVDRDGMPCVQHDIRARLRGSEQDVGNRILGYAKPEQRVTKHLAHGRDAQALSFEHQTEPNLRTLLSLRSHIPEISRIAHS